jgi:peptidoglycan hydrolase-like protein with peptidoglycan-binding domain
MSRDIYTEANEHFLKSGRQYEYGRPDMSLRNHGGDGHTDSSRTEQDNAEGHIHFMGSQVGSGPAEVNVTPGGYWDGKNMGIVGALRAKPEFRVREPLHGQASDAPTASVPAVQHSGAKHATPSTHMPDQSTPTHATPAHEAALRQGDKGDAARNLQTSLQHLGYQDEKGHKIQPDGDFGARTRAAVERFQRAHGLQPDGVVGPATKEALHAATPRLDGTGHPHNALYQQSRDAVHRLDAQHQRTPDQRSDQIAGALTTKAVGEGMNRVDHAVLNDDASKVYAVQGELNSPFKKVAEASTQEAANTSLEESGRQSLQIAAQQAPQPAATAPTQVPPSQAASPTV